MQLTIQIAVIAAAGPVLYFMSHWRAPQMVAALDLVRIERGQSPYTALELRQE